MRNAKRRPLLLAPLFFLAACTTTEVDPPRAKAKPPPPQPQSPDEALLIYVAHQIELFKQDAGRLPVDLAELAKKTEGHEPYLEAAVDSKGTPITYMLTAKGYRLIGAGPDGVMNTPDDITWPSRP